MKLSISAIIVLFRPNLTELKKLVDNLSSQVDSVILVDNTPEHAKEYTASFFENLSVYYIDLKDNLGIAAAHNKGILKALEMRSEFIIIFDQDSSIDHNFILNMFLVYKEISKKDSKIATVGPTFIDTKTGQKSYAIKYDGLVLKKIYSNNMTDNLVSDYIISSGSLFKSNIFEQVGLMDEKLFIDFVDIEWGIRAKKLGYNSYMSTKVFMNHAIGNSSKKIPVINKYINIHSDFRKYFIVRNAIYLVFHSKMPLNWKVIQIFKTIFYMISILLVSNNKFKVIGKYFLAIKDGVIKKMYKGSMQ
ncbi:rhamnosyltransferase family protein [Acinetobacter sp. 723929]|nr:MULTISPECIES: glycosyltransferase family 2 protein [Acinetobacter]EXI15036.1 rhamnosyltransferase family protein [Acinetobacter sp. 723929]KRI30335.1 hypothetical protein APB87_09415 [Acinetobacter pittii]KRJ74001.1 hypothetical protein APC93_12850 [Acinetobacter pittii]KRJ76248.1 hypothetical protein APC93_00235 [Acinetobacter pittii]MCK0788225.1 glycosyltransferase family 2 protein [Acinetobacter pittii]